MAQVKNQKPVQRMPAGYIKVFDELIEEFEIAGNQKDYGGWGDDWGPLLLFTFEHLAETEGVATCGPAVKWIPADVYGMAIGGRDVEMDYLFDIFFRALRWEKLVVVSKEGGHLRWRSKMAFTRKFGFGFNVLTKMTYGASLFCSRSAK